MSNEELEKSDKLITTQLIKILEKLYKDSNSEEDIIDEIEEWKKKNKTWSKVRKDKEIF